MIFTIGESDITDGFEEIVLSLSVGERKSVTLKPEKAYGYPDKDLLIEVPLAELPEELEFEIGDELELIDDDDESRLVVVTQLNEDSVVLDGNPPLAGESLTFEIELLAIG